MSTPLLNQVRVAERMLDHPSLTLLRRGQPVLVLAVLAEAFRNGATTVPADHVHALVAQAQDALADDESEGRRKSPREVCDTWTTGSTRWLTRAQDRDGQPGDDVYRLTDEAAATLEFLSSLTRSRVVTTETTVTTLLEAAKHAALAASVDPVERRALLERRRRDLEVALEDVDRDLEFLDRTGVVTPTGDNEVYNQYLALMGGFDALLRDLRSVESRIHDAGPALRRSFLADERPTGEIVSEYMTRLNTIVTETREGQGFDSARRLLDDPASRRDLRQAVTTVLEHPFVRALDPTERARAHGIVTAIHNANGAIFDARTSLNTALSGYVHSRHAAAHRALPKALAEAHAALDEWTQQHGRRSSTPIDLGLGRADVKTLRLKAARPAEQQAPPPLPANQTPAQEPDVQAMRDRGGPRYGELLHVLGERLEQAPTATIGQVLEAAAERAERPADLIGLLALATAGNAFLDTGGTETVVTRRPDGTEREFLIPAAIFTDLPAWTGAREETL